jgi:hypothetical protein
LISQFTPQESPKPHPISDNCFELHQSQEDQEAVMEIQQKMEALSVASKSKRFSKGLCEICGKVGINICSSCKHIRYCSKECQREDWPNHKVLCKSLKEYFKL